MRSFKELKVWQASHQFVLDVYKASASFPHEETYGLISQIRRCSSSIPTNIAEGCGRVGDPELAYFLNIAMGSASELEYHLILARDLGFLNEQSYLQLTETTIQIKKMLAAFIQKIRYQT